MDILQNDCPDSIKLIAWSKSFKNTSEEAQF